MRKIALIFSGQGSQSVGMGKEFYDSIPYAREIFDKADFLCDNELVDVMFHGPAEKLMSTAYSQPAIFTMSVAALAAFRFSARYKNIQPLFSAGLSLGEYSALYACGALSFEDTFMLLKKRSQFMEEATKLQVGKMAAIIGVDTDQIKEICAHCGCEVANFNSPQQTVITGHAQKVEAACEMLRQAGAKNVVMLEVSGAFHSSLMRPAAEKFKGELEKIVFNNPEFPLVSNVDGRPARDPSQIRANLARQITSSVQWIDTIKNIFAQGVTEFIEIGPGKVLKGLIRRIDPGLKVYNIEKPTDIEALPF